MGLCLFASISFAIIPTYVNCTILSSLRFINHQGRDVIVVVDIEKQIDYWRTGSEEDFEVARELVDLGRVRHGLFFAHLSLEKMLKAHVCRTTGALAPKIHNLVRLTELSGLSFSKQQEQFLARFDMYQLEGRYPDRLPALPEKRRAAQELQAVEELLQWLSKKF